MQILVLRSFRYSRDGITELAAGEGDKLDLPDHLIEGLVGAGFISIAEKPEAAAEPAPEPPALEPEPPAPERSQTAVRPPMRGGRR